MAAAEEEAAAQAPTDEAIAAAEMADAEEAPVEDEIMAGAAAESAPVSDEEAVALAEALAEENITPEELMALAEGEAEMAEGPIEEKVANLRSVGALLGRVSQINSLRAVGRGGTIKKAGIRKCSEMLEIVRGLKATAR